MWTHATSVAGRVVELGPAARPDPPDTRRRAVVPTSSAPTRIGADDRDLRRADQPGDAALGVPRASKPRAAEWNQARSCAYRSRTDVRSSPSGPAFVEAHAVRRASSVRRRSVIAPTRHSSSSVSSATSRVASCGAVCRSSRTSHERAASKTTSATRAARPRRRHGSARRRAGGGRRH